MRFQVIAPVVLAALLSVASPVTYEPDAAMAASPSSGLESLAGPSVRPENVPASHVATPFGYMAPECVIVLGEGERLHGKGILSLRDRSTRQVPACAHKRYGRSGAVLTAATRADQATLDGYDLVARIALPEGSALDTTGGFIATPAAPPTQADQSIYLLSSAQHGATPGRNALVNVLGWNMFNNGTQWTAAAMFLDEGGALLSSRPIPVEAGGVWQFEISDDGMGQAAGTYSSWSNDVNSGAITQLPSFMPPWEIKYTQPIVMATYSVDSCDKLPAGGTISGYGVTRQFSEPRSLTSTVQSIISEQDACEMKLELNTAYGDLQGSFLITYTAPAPQPVGRTARITYKTK